MRSVMIDKRLLNKIDGMSNIEDCCSVVFTDLKDTFWFSSPAELQEFLNVQSRERYYDKSLRKGYFDYINSDGDTYRYYVSSNRGTLTVINEENLGCINN